MIHKERTNCNWLCKDEPQSRLPVLIKKNLNDILPSNYNSHIINFNDKKQIEDDCFIESTIQYKNLYSLLANAVDYENSIARRIVYIAISKIEDIEKRKDNHIVCREMIKSIGELASQFINLSLQNNKTNKFLDLFNEALNRILRINPEIIKIPILPQTEPKCILEDLQAASDSSSSTSSRNNERKLFHLVDWSGDNTYNKEKGFDTEVLPEWIWSERLE